MIVNAVSNVLMDGGIALFPTETVYGLGVAVNTKKNIPGDYDRIFTIKRRNRTQVTPWLVADASALDVYGVDVTPQAYVLAKKFWPGALTLVVRASSVVPRCMQAADGTIALRVSKSAVVNALIQACGCPLATTSANTHGKPAATNFNDVEKKILDDVDVAINSGDTMATDASTIVNCVETNIKIIREGAIPSEKIISACTCL